MLACTKQLAGVGGWTLDREHPRLLLTQEYNRLLGLPEGQHLALRDQVQRARQRHVATHGKRLGEALAPLRLAMDEFDTDAAAAACRDLLFEPRHGSHRSTL